MKILLALGLFLYLSGCSSVSVNTDYDDSVDFSQYKTYKFYSGKDLDGDALAKHPLAKKRIVNSIKKALNAKGFTETSDNPDLIIATYAGIDQKMNVTTYGGHYGYGWYSPYWGGGMGVTQTDVNYYDEGTLIIDVVDAKKKALVWRGTGTQILRDYSSNEERQANIDDVVSQILDDFPPGSGKY
ncbi:MAG: DUF4136 domain-containing protein [Chlorobi bacterium]|nr:DUF4136 domain-containing protein [Chlorobiota bacterium]